MIEFCVEIDGRDTWFPVLERKRVKAAPQSYPSQWDAMQAIRHLQAVQPYVQFRAVPLPQAVAS